MSTLEAIDTTFDHRVRDASDYFASPRFKGIIRLYSPRQVVEQRGTITADYPIGAKPPRPFMRG
jgi:isocitrate lyase